MNGTATRIHIKNLLARTQHDGVVSEGHEPGEVDVDDDHDVEMPEELQLLQGNGSLAVRLRSVLQVTNRPNLTGGKKDHLSFSTTSHSRT